MSCVSSAWGFCQLAAGRDPPRHRALRTDEKLQSIALPSRGRRSLAAQCAVSAGPRGPSLFSGLAFWGFWALVLVLSLSVSVLPKPSTSRLLPESTG